MVDSSNSEYTKYHGISFAQFTKLVLDESEKNCQEINNCKLDYHWLPFISRCAYCDLFYSIIARAETLDEDQKYIGRMANVTFEKIGKINYRLFFRTSN